MKCDGNAPRTRRHGDLLSLPARPGALDRAHAPRARQPDPLHGPGGRILPWLAGARRACCSRSGLYMAWFLAPRRLPAGRDRADHVPARPGGLAGPVLLYASWRPRRSGTLVWRHPLADVSQKAAAPIGAAFTLICLVTGSLWGKPMWGTYWVWDARLTSVLVLFLMYCGILALWRTIDEPYAGRPGGVDPDPRRAPSTCRSSSSRSIGGTPCTSRPRCSGWAGRPSIPPCSIRSSSMARRLHADRLDAPPRRHAHRDPAPARAHAHDPRGRAPRPAGGLSLMDRTPASSSRPMR